MTDFGIARSEKDTQPITEPGTGFATPAFAAPEVLEGASPTPASDVYSLAKVIHMAATGGLPDGASDTGDPALDAVLTPAFATDPFERPTSREFANALRGGSSTRKLAVEQATPARRRATPRRSWPLTVASAALLAGIALVAVAALEETRNVVATTTNASADSNPESTTVIPTDSSAPPGTTAPTAVVSSDESGDVEAARAALAESIGAIHPSVLQPNEARDILGQVDDAVEKWRDGKDQEAAQKLAEVRRRIGERVGGEDRDAIWDALDALAETMGLERAR